MKNSQLNNLQGWRYFFIGSHKIAVYRHFVSASSMLAFCLSPLCLPLVYASLVFAYLPVRSRFCLPQRLIVTNKVSLSRKFLLADRLEIDLCPNRLLIALNRLSMTKFATAWLRWFAKIKNRNRTVRRSVWFVGCFRTLPSAFERLRDQRQSIAVVRKQTEIIGV